MNLHGLKTIGRLIGAVVICLTLSGCQTGGVGSTHPFLTMFRHTEDHPAVTHAVFETKMPGSLNRQACESADDAICVTR